MSWKAALTEYAKINGKYLIPKKGTLEYEKVKEIQARLAVNPETAPEVKKTKKSGKGVIKDAFVSVINKVNNTIDKNIPPVPEDIPLAQGEMHAKKLVRRDGKLLRQSYNWAGPGTHVERRISQNIQPIDNIDAAAKQHDIDYTLDFQKRMKRGEIVSKKEVQLTDKRFVEKS